MTTSDRDRTRGPPDLARRPHRGRDPTVPQAAATQPRDVSSGPAGSGRRRHLQLADRRAARGLAEPRRGLQALRRRRQRVLRLPRRVRRRRSPATPTRRSSRRSAPGSRRGTHFAQPTEDAIVVAENLAERFGQPLWRFAQLRHRGDDGRRPPDAGGHRPRPDHQGRGLLPRPPRLGAGLGAAPRPTTIGPADRPIGVAEQHRHPRRDHAT